jgi:hypothetical protein
MDETTSTVKHHAACSLQALPGNLLAAHRAALECLSLASRLFESSASESMEVVLLFRLDQALLDAVALIQPLKQEFRAVAQIRADPRRSGPHVANGSAPNADSEAVRQLTAARTHSGKRVSGDRSKLVLR